MHLSKPMKQNFTAQGVNLDACTFLKQYSRKKGILARNAGWGEKLELYNKGTK